MTHQNDCNPQPDNYDHVIVAFSGGKDSTACVLHLLDLGIPKSKIELWHHDIDGREGSTLMDWPCTRDYCRKFAATLGLAIFFSWKQGGFEREMLRDQQLTAPTVFETPHGNKQVGGINGNKNTRRKFPQVAADLRVRWCTAYLKIDVASAALRNQERLIGKKILFVTGERAEESSSRAKYKTFELHRADTRKSKRVPRHIDHWRPVHGWDERAVWNIIEKYMINVHPAYHLGWGRVSCAACIFGSKDQWASLSAINPAQTQRIFDYETTFKTTIHRKKNVMELIQEGTPYTAIRQNPDYIKIALSREYKTPILLNKWVLPAGAFGEKTGPS